MKKIAVIGLGLIGGSFAIDLKKQLNCQIIGIDANSKHLEVAQSLGIIDRKGNYDEIPEMDIVVVAVPVNVVTEVVCRVLDKVNEKALVFDVGSVKKRICKQLENHPKRSQFLAAHPLAGTEFSGPEAAISNLFEGKVMILCETEKTNWQLLDEALSIFKMMNMRIKMMNPEEHDRHIAYVSHLSHVSSFMLGKTVLEIEKNEQHIFDMASTGFASTVRLAKSEANTWTPIFLENKENVLKSLKEYILNLQSFEKLLENEDDASIRQVIRETNYIKKVLDKN